MKITTFACKKMAVAISASVILAACSTALVTPDGAANTRNKLMQLQANPELATRAPIEIQAAELAVVAAEKPERDLELSRHLVFVADHKVDIARNWAESRLLEDQREALSDASEQARLDSRTREAEVARNDAERARSDTQRARNATDVARNQATEARSDSAIARNQAQTARIDATVARNQAAASQAENEELASQILALNARDTDRGLVVTLGDVLFQTGKFAINGGNTGNLDKLAMFLNHYDDRTVSIEGHTDNVGSTASNTTLSQNRANAVKEYLVTKGIATTRLSTTGEGESSPVSSNDTDTGRQQNRRVEVIIANSDTALPLQ